MKNKMVICGSHSFHKWRLKKTSLSLFFSSSFSFGYFFSFPFICGRSLGIYFVFRHSFHTENKITWNILLFFFVFFKMILFFWVLKKRKKKVKQQKTDVISEFWVSFSFFKNFWNKFFFKPEKEVLKSQSRILRMKFFHHLCQNSKP